MSLAPRRELRTPMDWVWQNRQWRQPESSIGEVAVGFLESARLGDVSVARLIANVIRETLPAPLAARCAPGPLRGGRLTLWVDCPTSRYELQSRWTPALLQAANEQLVSADVRQIIYRLRTAGDA